MSPRICMMRCARLAGSMVWSVAVEASCTTVLGCLNRPTRNCAGVGARGVAGEVEVLGKVEGGGQGKAPTRLHTRLPPQPRPCPRRTLLLPEGGFSLQ